MSEYIGLWQGCAMKRRYTVTKQWQQIFVGSYLSNIRLIMIINDTCIIMIKSYFQTVPQVAEFGFKLTMWPSGQR